jgi:type I restriction enzyme S subunit
MSEENNIPEHWKWLKLGDACEIVSGNTPKGLENVSNQGDFQFYKVSDMNLAGNEIKMNISNVKLTTEEIKNLRIKIYPKGTVIFPKRGGAILTNKKRLLSQNASFDLNLMGIIPNEEVSSNFLFYWFQKLDLSRIYDGSNVPQINNKNVAPLNFPIPPISEQQVIVSKIEELLSDLENGKQQLQLAQQQLKIYRQSLLKWAFEGKLTNKNVKDGELPKGWIENEISNVCSNIKVGIVIKPTNFYSKNGKGIKAFRSANVREFKINDTDWVYFTDEANEVNHRTKLKSGDVLLVRSGYPGTSCIVSKEFDGCNAIDILIATPNKEKILSQYLCYFNNSPLGKGLFISKSRGVAQKHLNVGEYSKLKIHIPSLMEQSQIIQELESKLTVCDKIEETISQSLLQAESLRQSILKKAFEGKLV